MIHALKRNPIARIAFFITADVLLITAAFFFAFLIRFEGQIPPYYYAFLSRIIALAVIFIIPIFYLHRLYFFSWSYVSTDEVISLFKATTISFVFIGIAIYISHHFPAFTNFPRATIFISYILVFLFCGGFRFAKRVYLHSVSFGGLGRRERTLIVGAGDAGEQILRNMLSDKMDAYLPIGFVDDSRIKQGMKIHGLKVLGKISDIPRIVQTHQVRQLVVALPSAGTKTIKEAVEIGRKAGLRKIKIAPSVAEILRGSASLKHLREMDVEDLLGRNPIGLEKDDIESLIKGKVVLITGAAGSIGSELSRQASTFNPELLVLLDHDETGIFNIVKELKEEGPPDLRLGHFVLDIKDKDKVDTVFAECKPQVVLHAAAYKHVPLMEAQPDEAVKNNVIGTDIIAEASLHCHVEKFIFISTDKAVNPSSVMGATKRIGEMVCQMHNARGQTKFISVRFGNVLNSRGSVIPIFKEQIHRGGPVTVTDAEMKRYFMLISEACLLVLQAGAMGHGGEVFVLDMGEPVKIHDLAREMIKLSGLEPDKDIAIVFTGIRPGEKLFEEILTAEEGTVATLNKKIFMARLSSTHDAFTSQLAELKSAALKGNGRKIREIFKSLIPSYDSGQNGFV